MVVYYLIQGTTVLDKTFEPTVLDIKQAEDYFITAGWLVKATILRVDLDGSTQQMEYDYE